MEALVGGAVRVQAPRVAQLTLVVASQSTRAGAAVGPALKVTLSAFHLVQFLLAEVAGPDTCLSMIHRMLGALLFLLCHKFSR